MPKSGPIIIVEDDVDDQELLKEILDDLKVPNILRFFDSCMDALNYLLSTIERPFLIISDINVPAMTGIDFLKSINDHDQLRSKNIPFVFLTTSSDNNMIAQAFQLCVQGFFVKPNNMRELKEMMKMILDYWRICSRPAL